jgi:predicted glycogen debranching enzyme
MSPPRNPRSAPRRGGAQAAIPARPKDHSESHGSGDAAVFSPAVFFGPEICHDLAAAEQREWLVTNGLGGFASGTVAGSSTRRYHGLLIAALNPPAARTHLVGALDEILTAGGTSYELAAHRWASGAVAPEGHLLIESFRLEKSIPVWIYRAGSARIEKRIWMRHGENTTFVHYTLLDAPAHVALELKALVNHRDFHSVTHAGSAPHEWRMRIEPVESGLRVTPFDGATPFYLKSHAATAEPQHIWYRDFFYACENDRGLEDHEDLLLAGVFRATLEKGKFVTLVFSTDANTDLDGDIALQAERQRQSETVTTGTPTLRLASAVSSSRSPAWLPQLLLAADQFLVKRPLPGQPDGMSVIAGYHWFGDWGRDTMIALPGLALATGRSAIARQILLAFSQYVDGGMLPNNFPDATGSPGYNTIDATQWYFEAIRQYVAATNDLQTLATLFPVLEKIIAAHLEGTRYNIHVDPDDGLLYGGGPGVQLTWMDAKIGDWVVTPRSGKPVEINALWVNALESMSRFAQELNQPLDLYQRPSGRAKSSFQKFWNAERNYCFDVIDAPGIGNDSVLRPNQILAVSLPVSPLTTEQQRAVVETCAAHLHTRFGLRSLAPGQPGYAGVYSGGVRERDSTYHQGTVWGWLLGPFALAHYRVYRDRAAAFAFLESLANAINIYGVGTLSEIFDGDPPHHPRGCIAQAWSVAELLRAWTSLATSDS